MSTPILRAAGVSRSYGDRRVITDLSFAVAPGHRLGVVGENGIGKSTLLRLLAGLEEPDTGQVIRPGDLVHLAQEPPFSSSATVADVMASALAEVYAVAAELEESASALAQPGPESAARYDRALAGAEAAGVWDADVRAQRVLAGLGLGELDRTRPVESLSGGQRSRLALAAVLVRRPRAVLLDEPTNHLDDDAVDFLAAALVDLPGAVVLASHDRVFLDEVVTEILDLDPGLDGPHVIGGSYTDFREAKRVAREQWEQRWLAERAELSALRAAVAPGGAARQVAHGRAITDRNKMAYGMHGDTVQQQVGRRVRSVQRRLSELERAQVRRPPRELRFAAALTGRSGRSGALISVRDAVVPGRVGVPVLDVHADATLLITGPNGSGKSTVLQLLSGDLEPARGVVWRAKGIRVALLEQDVGLGEDGRTARAVYDLIAARLGAVVPLQELGLVAARDLDRPMRELSVGQRRRVVLALLVAQAPDVLLLDEPTNHISLTLADELGEALHTAPGAVVVTSHDRWLRQHWHGDRVELDDGRLRVDRHG